ncbi:MAG TPA: Lrp/AsnC family transcriptional regulator [Candidatus Marinimicrobia bacterium]|nr:Lrp/AsnC family transcriptional regulator [Candidatus Neomarinimicrobiota bacterium]
MMDHIDKTILKHLQENGRITYQDLAEITKMTIPAVRDRIFKMREQGIIRKFTTILDSKKLDRDVMAFISLLTSSSKHFTDIIQMVELTPEIQECYSVTGGGSHILKAITKNMTTLEKLLAEIQTWPGVTRTESSLVLSTFKETTVLELDE